MSFNDSPESCEQAAKLQYKKLKLKGKPQSYLDNYVNSRGTFIGKFKITDKDGLITGFNEHGHANILLYEGVDLESIRDKDFESIIDYEDEGTGK